MPLILKIRVGQHAFGAASLTFKHNFVIFGIWNSQPKIAVYEAGNQVISEKLDATEAVDLIEADSAEDVEKTVQDQKADTGAVFTAEAKTRLEAGERATVEVYINGESLAKSRAISLAALTDAIREATPGAPQIDFEQVKLGDEKALSLMEMLLPFFLHPELRGRGLEERYCQRMGFDAAWLPWYRALECFAVRQWVLEKGQPFEQHTAESMGVALARWLDGA